MKQFWLIVYSCLLLSTVWPFNPCAEGEDSLFLMFWNLENYFDWRQSNHPQKTWSRNKFRTKSRIISKAIFWMADKEGKVPDLIGVAEIENRFVLERLLRDTPLDKAGYGIIHYDSSDPRGIDVALFYRKQRLRLIGSKPICAGEGTRDILLAEFLRPEGDSLAILVNHHPSKYGGSPSSQRRAFAIDRLREVTDSIISRGYRQVVAMGDFNDTPESTAEYSKTMVNLAMPLASKGLGTIKYSGKWEMIDMFFISPLIAAGNPEARMEVVHIPFLMTRDGAHSGEKPLRTYTGPRYSGGVSDHCPITLMIQ